MAASIASSLEPELIGIVGERHVFSGGAIDERYRTDFTGKYRSEPAHVVRPGSTEDVARLMRLAARRGLSVTPMGGRSGLVGGGLAADGGILLSLERMNRIHEIDTLSMTMTVDAGCVLQVAQDAAADADAFLPLDLGGRGSAMIGGVIATNAGGNRVLRWGMTRDMVIGLEVVLADGTIVSSLTKMLKDNAGYNWKHLIIGSEGTLAVVTRAVLRLRPLPTTVQTAILAAPSFDAAIRLLRRLEAGTSGRLSSFELMWPDFYQAMTDALLPAPRPLAPTYPFYAIVEAMGSDPEGDAAQFERVLGGVIDEGLASDAVVAQSDRERAAIWEIRDNVGPKLAPFLPMVYYDVSMGLGDMPAFVDDARARVAQVFPAARAMFYGHAGDGNLHAIISPGRDDAEAHRLIDTAIFSAVRGVGGSIAAEHGVGVLRAPYLAMTRAPEELDLMRRLKSALDPDRVMNPGKLLDASGN